jgi:hypothetical protein
VQRHDERSPEDAARSGRIRCGPTAGQTCNGGGHGERPVPGNDPPLTPGTRTAVIKLH